MKRRTNGSRAPGPAALTVAASALGVTIALAACGGKSDEAKVRDAVNGFDKTLFDNKFQQACSYLSDDLVRSAFHDNKACAAQIETKNPATEGGMIKSVKVKGDRATVVAQGVTEGPATLNLAKRNGAWKITGPLKYFRG